MSELVIKVPVPHGLSEDEIRHRMNQLIDKSGTDIPGGVRNVQVRWLGNVAQYSFTAHGYKVSGHMTIQLPEIIIEALIPFMFVLFKDKISQVITQHATELLAEHET